LLEALRAFDTEGKFIGAICAAPAILQAAGVLHGRKAVCYPGMEVHVRDAKLQSGCNVVRDGNLITGTGPGTAMEFSLAVLEMLVGKECRDSVAKALLFQ